jgi:twitching motility protein PilJ
VNTSASQSKPRHAIVDRFYSLPLERKQLIALIICQLIPILGFGIGSTLVLISSLRTQLLEQAKSEVAVTDTNYNIKVNQMGFGSRGQSDNPAIINAVKAGQTGSEDVKGQAKQILQNEVKARKMEYATLIGRDLRIIVNANTSRAGEEIADKKLAELIQQSIKEGRQIKASEVVSGSELQKEGAVLPDGIGSQDALIRYVITPIRNPGNQDVLGVLLFGDIVNGKAVIVENTQKAFGGGYSAVYLRQPSGEFALVTSQKQENKDQPVISAPLPDPQILANAAQGRGSVATQRLSVGGNVFTVAAKALPNRLIETSEGTTPVVTDAPTAILVRGTAEGTLNQLLGKSLFQQALVLLTSLCAIAAWSLIFRQTILKPIKDLQKATEKFAAGDHDARSVVHGEDEIGQLAVSFNQMADNIAESETSLSQDARLQEQQVKEAKALSDITVRMRQLNQPDQILQVAVDEVRRFLNVDRVIILRFSNSPSLEASVITEAAAINSISVIGRAITDWLGLEDFEKYSEELVWSTSDAELATGLYQENLTQFNVKSELIAPLKRNDGKGERLAGLICAQKCSQARKWEESELTFFGQLATQIGYALDQSQLFQERQTALQDSELLKESLQSQIIRLLSDVQGVARGDLTLRASAVSGDLGTVADFFNAIVESLRQLVLKVQQSSTQVNSLLMENEGAVRRVADEAKQQVNETTRILSSVEQITQTTQVLTERSQQAASVAETAATAARNGETAMETSVKSIYRLRGTIEDATQKVKQLGESSHQISRIVSLINELAVQTDLLAINASIEASRAGDQGRGFAIVANEIGELASRSASSTRDIEKMIDSLQKQISEIVEIMNQGAVQVVEGSHSVKNTKQGFVHLVYVAQQIDELVKSISQAVTTQEANSRSLTTVIQDVAQVSVRTSDSSRRVSEALRQTVEVADELQKSVGTFRVHSGKVES